MAVGEKLRRNEDVGWELEFGTEPDDTQMRLYHDWLETLNKENETQNEIEAAIRADDLVRIFFQETAKHSLLGPDEVKMLVDSARGYSASEDPVEQLRGREDFNKLVSANIRLVISVAKRYTGRGMEFLDLIQEGNLGLMNGARKFDPDRGWQFSTYVSWWIEQRITRELSRQSRSIQIPEYLNQPISEYLRAKEQLYAEGKTVTEESIKFLLGWSKEKLRYIEDAIQVQSVVELDDSKEGGGANKIEFLEIDRSNSPVILAEKALLEVGINNLLQQMDTRLAQVLMLTYGLNGSKAETRQEVRRIMNVDEEGLNELMGRAKRRLKKLIELAKLEDYIGNVNDEKRELGKRRQMAEKELGWWIEYLGRRLEDSNDQNEK